LVNNSYGHLRQFPGLLITRKAISAYAIDDKFRENGKLAFLNHDELQEFILNFNKVNYPEDKADHFRTAGELNALLIINTAMRIVAEKVIDVPTLKFSADLKRRIIDETGNYNYENVIEKFKTLFAAEEDSISNLYSLYLEMALNGIIAQNSALKEFSRLVYDDKLSSDPAYQKFLPALNSGLEKVLLPDNETDLISFLRKPSELHPDSVLAQVEYIRDNWSEFLGDFLNVLLTGLDILKEEQKFWLGGAGDVPVYNFEMTEDEYEKFSQDSDWMPHLVLIAKSTYVWLDQLSKKYGRSIFRLDQIPDEELQILAERGFTGLWFIGVWQRSYASKKIKNLSGNNDVIASAYSLADYRIASELGGEEAMIELQHRAGRFGIRIACDMVPNHMGLDSDWVVDHPEWFLQLPQQPYPAYSFQGQDLSGRNEVEVHIEDHYYEKTDAAVVYKLHDKRDDRIRYIYHGNDGTGIPWNDTAQLNYLLPEVREAVIENIVRIARQFPIIRFDAAMTLAKKHIHRLWFPEPGSGGDIATRANHGMSRQEFDKHIPDEFWREVVDRVAEEAPNTLLLAEAFWMMEGYFVRTLGMHRVYNSAFMNMLKNEENSKYRKSIFNIIEFNPEILKRFVNFMSNPDEDTAIAQFGKDDKYFGVCILMITMPGLPMFAHGQTEGFTERYGMEFPKARWEESEDDHLVQRHQREIFPLLKKRILFSEVKNFLLFDFLNEHGGINENVFAYSNRNQGQQSLIIYNNKFENTAGWIYEANTVIRDNDEPVWIKKTLGEALQIPDDPDHFIIFKDHIKDLEYIRNCREVHQKGLFQTLDAFKYMVLLDFRVIKDDAEKRFARLAEYLQGGGVPDISISLKKLSYRKLHASFHSAAGKEILKQIREFKQKPDELKKFQPEFKYRIGNFLEQLDQYSGDTYEIDDIASKINTDLKDWLALPDKYLLSDELQNAIYFFWIIFRNIPASPKAGSESDLTEMLNEFLLANEICEVLRTLNINVEPDFLSELLIALIRSDSIFTSLKKDNVTNEIQSLLQRSEVQKVVGSNKFNKITWFNQEKMEFYLTMLFAANIHTIYSVRPVKKKSLNSFDRLLMEVEKKVNVALKNSQFDLDKFIDLLN